MQLKEPAARRARPHLRRGAPPARAAGPCRGAGRGRARQRSGRGRAGRGRRRPARGRVRAGPGCAPGGGLVDVHAQYYRSRRFSCSIFLNVRKLLFTVCGRSLGRTGVIVTGSVCAWRLSFCAAAPLRPLGASRACLAATLAQPGRRAHAAGSLMRLRCRAEPGRVASGACAPCCVRSTAYTVAWQSPHFHTTILLLFAGRHGGGRPHIRDTSFLHRRVSTGWGAQAAGCRRARAVRWARPRA